MAKESLIEREYRGKKIRVTPDFQFKVLTADDDDGDEPHYQMFESYRDAEAYVDGLVARERVKTREAVALCALDRDGAEIVIRGLHARTGDILTEPKSACAPFYPLVPWVRAAKKKLLQLRLEVEVLEIVLSPFETAAGGRYGFSRRDYETELKNFIAEFGERVAKAKATTWATEFARAEKEIAKEKLDDR